MTIGLSTLNTKLTKLDFQQTFTCSKSKIEILEKGVK